MKNKQVKKVDSTEELRTNYLQNRSAMLEDFASALKEVLRKQPSVGGKIAGMDYQQFSATSVFRMIGEQEDYIAYTEKHKPKYVVLTEEKKILKDMIKQAKKVFKDQYNNWYSEYAHD